MLKWEAEIIRSLRTHWPDTLTYMVKFQANKNLYLKGKKKKKTPDKQYPKFL